MARPRQSPAYMGVQSQQPMERAAAPGPVAVLPSLSVTVGEVKSWSTKFPVTLVEAGLEFAREVLRPGGAFVAKVLAGGADHALVAELKRNFTTVKHAKPPASRKGSSEWYVVAQGFKGVPEQAS